MSAGSHLLRLVALLAVCFLALQLYFVGRIALMAVADPQSTTFQRSEMWRMASQQGWVAWGHQWVPSDRITPHLKRRLQFYRPQRRRLGSDGASLGTQPACAGAG
jgi:hypothetical protein